MKFKRRVILETGLKQIDIAPLIDCMFLLLIFFLLTSSFVIIPGIHIKLPKAVTAENLSTQTLTITITSEDLTYLYGEPKTLNEIETYIKDKKFESIFIKSDRDASLGVVVRIWDICKRLGIEKIGIATTAVE